MLSRAWSRVPKPCLGMGLAVLSGVGLAILRRMARRSLSTRGGRRLTQLRNPVPPDVEVSQSVPLAPVRDIFADQFGLKDDEIFSYGPYKGKVSLESGEPARTDFITLC